MWSTFLTTLRTNLREKSSLFWLFCFPILLSTMFLGMFGNLGATYEITTMRFAVVANGDYCKAEGAQQLIAAMQRTPVTPQGCGTASTAMDVDSGGTDLHDLLDLTAVDTSDDASRLIMLATAAVLILILGALLFMLVKPVKSDEDEKEENPVAVLDESGKEDEKLNQGQQQTASGQAAGDDQGAQNQSAGDSQAAQNQDAHAKEAEEAEKPEEHESQQVAAASADAAEDNAAAQQDSGENTAAAVEVGDSAPAQQQNDNGSVQTQEKEPAAAENSSGGWTTDEDGNEVYYAGNGEENTDYDQTGTPSSDDEYILPDSDKRYYTREELNKLSDYDLQMAINEIYARHGRKFDTESIRKYFESKSWYHGTIAPADFDGNESKYFNAYETANRELMIQIRDQRGANLQW